MARTMNVKEIANNYKDTILYLFFGVCSTLTNIVIYWVCAHPFTLNVMLSTIIAWAAAVLFAYLTNRKMVFHSSANGLNDILKELTSFFWCRLATGIMDWLCMFFFVTKLEWNDVLIKTIANILVIILNYVASKFFIFKRHDAE